MSTTNVFPLRGLSLEVKAQLQALAQANHRSLTKQILVILEAAVEKSSRRATKKGRT